MSDRDPFLDALSEALADAPVPAGEVQRPLHILYRDDDMIAVYKPAGWLVHRSAIARHETRFVLQRLRDQIGQHVFPVHRLDQGTCGVLLFGLHKEATQKLAGHFAHHTARKHYLALARGWVPAEIDVDYALKPDDAPENAPAQPAQTLLRGLAQLEWPEAYDQRHAGTRISLVEAFPKTGRRHQIRRHLKHESHPIIGDSTHGKGPLNRWWAERIGLQRLWLHAHALDIPHPRTEEMLHLRADWRALADVPEVQQWQKLLALPYWRGGPHALPETCGVAL